MSDFISREDAKLAVVDVAQSRENGFQWGEAVTFTPSKIIGLINKIPAADVKPVVHGSWVNNQELARFACSSKGMYQCSECNQWINVFQVSGEMNYCPNCGADMREETEK